MKTIVFALSGLAFVLAADAATPMSARAEEPKAEQAYTPPKDQTDTKEFGETERGSRTAAKINREKKMKAKNRKLRSGYLRRIR